MTSLKRASLAFLGFVLGGLTGCAIYPYDEYGIGGSIEIVGDPYGDCYDCGMDLEIELSWDGAWSCSSSCADLDLKVVTPDGYTITAWNDGSDGCIHLGNDLGGANGGSETIICSAPSSGAYDVRAISRSDGEIPATVTVRRVSGSYPYSLEFEDRREISVAPWGESDLSVVIR